MSDSTHQLKSDSVQAAYQEGRRVGLATAALALSIVSFLNLLGVEKSLLAIALALLAMQGAKPVAAASRRSRIALAIAAEKIDPRLRGNDGIRRQEFNFAAEFARAL